MNAALIALLLLSIGALLSSLHASLSDLVRTTLEEMAEKSPSRKKKASIHAILEDVAGHARAVAFLRTPCSLGGAIALVFMSAAIRGDLSPNWIDGLIGGAIAAALLWFLSVLIPEAVSRHAGERFVFALAGLVRAIHALAAPLRPLATFFDGLLRAMSGSRPEDAADQVEAEVRSALDEAEREGGVDERERDMIEAVMKFKDLTVEQIMTPRNEIEALELTSNLGQVAAFVRKARHSRIPVYRGGDGGGLDEIVGLFYVKDLLRWLAGEGAHSGKGFDLRAILRPAMVVPESKTIRQLLDEFVAKRVHVAIVADEYGGTAGIVSLEDIIEEVFGEIQDEYEKAEDDPPRIDARIDDGIVECDARTAIHDLNDALEPLGVSIPEGEDYDTIAGYALAAFGRIPETNESIQVAPRTLITVLEATPTRIVTVRIQVKPEEHTHDVEPAPAAASREADKGK
jgi:CBS domain containing-hemolysin-like protein